MTDLFEAETASTTSLDMRRLQRRQRRATRRKWTLVASAVALVVLALGSSVAYSFVKSLSPSESAVADYTGAGSGSIQVVVEAGDTGADIAQTLYDAGVIASTEAFIVAWNQNPDSSSISAGYYFMQREMQASLALDQLLNPDYRDVRTLTVIEGKTLDTYYQKIADLTEYSLDDVKAAAADSAAIGLPAEANGNLEGWLFPSTYTFNPGVTPTDVLSKMVSTTVEVLDRNGVAPEDYERILTVASLVEREAGTDEDRPMIAGVIYNRLAIDMPLQLDSTVHYFAPSDSVFTSDADRAIDNPYNTYLYTGLPPGPIAAPGEASIQAAVNPTQHDYLYFVTVNLTTKETRYAVTYADHLKNVQLLQDWYAANGG
ncbi:endolytic transglycosylase MltG [Demequina capsici]|uniref:Endolytic murein transglycosylase n=1 Tax=Demequina capsici TaxID=3075620 RepID=A0AA96J809_9MICO|nr:MULTISPECIES: endolytic transglycosylase MltG [unclassified Demequina]WNM25767.1 endolytic transglycosylase MltG [Demequina sp. OYTSA14]WNM28663.1 endolytic transglycosylase MltG [Demequina sp. PMTSA13]